MPLSIEKSIKVSLQFKMDIFELAYLVIKIGLVLAFAQLCYVMYKALYVPWSLRKYYKKYNVVMAKDYHPFLGDVALLEQNMANKTGNFTHYVKEIEENPSADLRFTQLGPECLIELCSVRATTELEKLSPSKIDRTVNNMQPLINMFGDAFGFNPSNESWNERRTFIMKTIGINYCSKYIKLMLNSIDKAVEEFKVGEEVDILHTLLLTTFSVITKIFYGDDIDKVIPTLEYVDPYTGNKSTKSFSAFYL